MTDPAAEAPRPPGRRSVKRALASIVLVFEVIIVFLASLVVFGLDVLPPAVALGGGAVLSLLLVATIALLRFGWAYVVGWVLQGVVVATGFLTPVMFVIGALFAAMWVYCMITGDRIDRLKETE